ncbi:hypothetical protein CMUS01_15402 [Colletotrichum musicola]|uniref:Uncharacterized protein n=1 Tax=Colletotrichum musicola TaxID=2175873 RepID=A0A8H6IXC5_9PEZI|nr:hypothetical protein CMUS01_15402 [Colletotrichum musicola]
MLKRGQERQQEWFGAVCDHVAREINEVNGAPTRRAVQRSIEALLSRHWLAEAAPADSAPGTLEASGPASAHEQQPASPPPGTGSTLPDSDAGEEPLIGGAGDPTTEHLPARRTAGASSSRTSPTSAQRPAPARTTHLEISPPPGAHRHAHVALACQLASRSGRATATRASTLHARQTCDSRLP